MSRLKITAAALALSSAVARAAEVQIPGLSVKMEEHMDPLLRGLAYALVFTVVGLALFGIAFALMGKFCPFSIRKEIEEDQNTALAVLMGSVILGIAIIVAAAIHG